MRILHTSDWHIGRTFHGYSTLPAIAEVLGELAPIIGEHGIDVVIAAGDVFDTANPSGEAYRVLQATLEAILAAGAKVIVTSGNHDSPRRLGFAGPFTALAGLHLVTDPATVGRAVTIDDEHGPVDFYALPYLEPALVRAEPWTRPGVRSQHDVVRDAMEPIRDTAAARRDAGARSVVIAHTFVAGAESESSDSERPIVAGGVDSVPVGVLDGVDYVALGHIHGRATLAEGVRYSGAPLHYSFKEAGKPRGGWVVDLDAHGLAGVAWVDLPVPRPLAVLTDTFEGLLTDPAYQTHHDHWVSATYTDRSRRIDPMNQLRTRFPWCAEVRHQPSESAEQSRSVAQRVRGLTDEQIVANFLVEVRNGENPGADETMIMAEVIAEHRARGQRS